MDGGLEDGGFGTSPSRVGVVVHGHGCWFGDDDVGILVGEDGYSCSLCFFALWSLFG